MHTILLIIAIVFMTVAFFNVYLSKPKEVITTDTVIKRDTVWNDTVIYKDREKPVPKLVEVIKHDTIIADTVLTTEQKYYQETFYMGKDTATVGVLTTGINTEVDSISVLLRTRKPTVVQTVEVTKYIEKNRSIIHIQPQATFGYDPLNKQWGAVVGFGIGVDI